MASDLSAHINIGKNTESKLKQAGIDSFRKLNALVTEKAFIKLLSIDPGACLSLLYGLDGAIQDIKWNLLPKERKLELQEFYKSVKR